MCKRLLIRVRHVYRVEIVARSQLDLSPVDGSSMNVLFANAIDEFAMDKIAIIQADNSGFNLNLSHLCLEEPSQ